MAEQAPATLWITAHEGARVTGYHSHETGQLFALREGLQVIETPSGRWVQPPGWIGWIAPRCAHAAQSFGATAGWSLHIDAAMAQALPDGPHVFAVTPLMRALVDRLTGMDASEPLLEPRRGRLVGVLLDELAAGDKPSLHLPMPQDRRLAAVAAALADDPALPDGIDEWADRIGMARRTLTRRFAAETGLSFAQWRQQARLLKAVELLSLRESVTAVALTVGYSSVSAFIEAFRKHFGCTPARFFEEGGTMPQAKKKPA
ncbi:helix-turn-helix transcriptional regulator [Variovorax sp. CAN2819]|uniref:helix-turn-helix transcriptional regulator n=1 Tax=Variovorax sp. CAN15 TaxID=3046727 RepID=UPI0026470806|nr:helix-turn-helix transcriptional regulator [Variovorax sp. CAN15]MDN6884352.1 helix-turn-helix transcriptional regulator [Variovorax sp. CAN15]